MLKFIVDNLDGVAENLRHLYVKRESDGKYVLQVEGAVPAEKLTEFRDNNIQLKKDLEKFKDVDPEEYARLMKIKDDLEKGKLKDGKTVDQVVEERTAAMRKQFDTEKTDLTKRLETTTGELSKLRIVDAAIATATELGLRPSARDDLAARVAGVFTLRDGKPVAIKDGAEVYGKTGEPLTIKEHVSALVETAPHLFEASQGTGANNQQRQGQRPGLNGVNPWAKATWNVTKQGEAFRANPDAARKMALEHGVTIP